MYKRQEKGKAVKSRSDEEIASFKEDPKAYQNQVVEKASDYKDLAVDTFQDYKTKFENGEILSLIHILRKATVGATPKLESSEAPIKASASEQRERMKAKSIMIRMAVTELWPMVVRIRVGR